MNFNQFNGAFVPPAADSSQTSTHRRASGTDVDLASSYRNARCSTAPMLGNMAEGALRGNGRSSLAALARNLLRVLPAAVLQV